MLTLSSEFSNHTVLTNVFNRGNSELLIFVYIYAQ